MEDQEAEPTLVMVGITLRPLFGSHAEREEVTAAVLASLPSRYVYEGNVYERVDEWAVTAAMMQELMRNDHGDDTQGGKDRSRSKRGRSLAEYEEAKLVERTDPEEEPAE